jgi:hypothetical protein
LLLGCLVTLRHVRLRIIVRNYLILRWSRVHQIGIVLYLVSTRLVGVPVICGCVICGCVGSDRLVGIQMGISFDFLKGTRITTVEDDALVSDVGLSFLAPEVADNLRPGGKGFLFFFLEENLPLELGNHFSGAACGGVLEGLQDVSLAQ